MTDHCTCMSVMCCAGRPSLAVGSPEVAAQWHPTRNGSKTAEDVTAGSDRKVWWLCKEGKCGHSHIWQATVLSRTALGRACPICSNRKPCICNNLAVLHPDEVESHWDWEHNTVQPTELKPQSSVKVHWLCQKHDPVFRWTARPTDRLGSRKTGCPKCAGRAK